MATIIDWPVALRPRSVEWGLITSQWGGASVFDGSIQAVSLGAPRWSFSITTGVLRWDAVPAWEAFIDQLDGEVNRVRAWDWRRESPLGPGSVGATVRISTAGVTLATQGWPINTVGVLRAGSWVGVNGELKRLSVTADSDASGRATLVLRPPLRMAPAVGTALVLVKPTALFVLKTKQPMMGQDGARSTGWSLSFEEVFA
jgi:hypothetical protein